MNPQQSTHLSDIRYKIVFLGQMSTGKTSIIDRFSKNSFNTSIQQTIAIDLTTHNLCYKHLTYKLQLWDTAGQQKYRSIVPNYIRAAHCVVFVYDVTDERSLDALRHWHDMFKSYQPDGAIAILVGNKVDKEQERKVSQQKGQKWAAEADMAFAQVSAKTGQGVQDVFHSILENILIVGKGKHNQENERQDNEGETKEQSGFNKGDGSDILKNKKGLDNYGEFSDSGKVKNLNKRQILQIKQTKKQFVCCYI